VRSLLKLAGVAKHGPLVPVYLGGMVLLLISLAVLDHWFVLALAAILTAGYVLAKRYGGAE